MDRKYLFNEWLEAQRQKAAGKRKHGKPFIGERGYPHIDGKVHFPRPGVPAEQAAWLEEVLTNGQKLTHHGFLPFIRDDQRQRRYRIPPEDYDPTALHGRDQKLFPHIKTRPIMYASHRDACIYSYYAFALQQVYEQRLIDTGLNRHVIAYRSIDGKNNVNFAKEAFDEMSARKEYDCIMIDVKSFFDSLDHEILAARWGSLLRGGLTRNPDQLIIYNRITKYRYFIAGEAGHLLRSSGRRYNIKEYGCSKFCTQDDYNKFIKKNRACQPLS
jgi:RNA-directed DNA polymerase